MSAKYIFILNRRINSIKIKLEIDNKILQLHLKGGLDKASR